MNAVDTNVFVYAFDTDEAEKQAKARALLARLAAERGATVMPWQVAGEFLNQLRRWESKGRLPAAEVEAIFQRVLSMFDLRTPTATCFRISFDLRRRYSLSHWDAMLLAACKEAGVTTLYSEDMAAGMNYDGLVVANPFA